MFAANDRLTPEGIRLVRMIDAHLSAKKPMTPELRHYAAMVYQARLLKPTQWLEQFEDKAQTVWALFQPEDHPDDDEDENRS